MVSAQSEKKQLTDNERNGRTPQSRPDSERVRHRESAVLSSALLGDHNDMQAPVDARSLKRSVSDSHYSVGMENRSAANPRTQKLEPDSRLIAHLPYGFLSADGVEELLFGQSLLGALVAGPPAASRALCATGSVDHQVTERRVRRAIGITHRTVLNAPQSCVSEPGPC